MADGYEDLREDELPGPAYEGYESAELACPAERSGHVAVSDGRHMFVWGGYKFYMLDSRSTDRVLHWERIDCQGVPPSSKDKLGVWVYKNKLIFFGGYGYLPEDKVLGTFEFDETSFWGKPPSPRAAHACAAVGNKGFVFGGRYRAHSNEILIFSVQPKSLVRLSLEAVICFKEMLANSWNCLPKHLLHSVNQRFGSNNTSGS
ncbi:hypothetical protein G4228_008721 [Cervus hanglu yarkandensis]|nr:hypothetical protein G4228_008721 [Cervus hanglu yarkandensis]